MSNIPSTSISQALTPVQRQAHESVRARNIQRMKDFHHTEEVEELDDTAVRSVDDEQAGGGGGGGAGGKAGQQRREEEERVEIEALEGKAAVAKSSEEAPPPRLDISA